LQRWILVQRRQGVRRYRQLHRSHVPGQCCLRRPSCAQNRIRLCLPAWFIHRRLALHSVQCWQVPRQVGSKVLSLLYCRLLLGRWLVQLHRLSFEPVCKLARLILLHHVRHPSVHTQNRLHHLHILFVRRALDHVLDSLQMCAASTASPSRAPPTPHARLASTATRAPTARCRALTASTAPTALSPV